MAMTKDEFHAAIKRHGYTVAEFAVEFGVAPSTAYEWGTRCGIPRWAVRVLAVMDQHGTAVFARVKPRERSVGQDAPSPAKQAEPRPRSTRQPQHRRRSVSGAGEAA